MIFMEVVQEIDSGKFVRDYNLEGWGVETTSSIESAFKFDQRRWKEFKREYNEMGEYELVQV
jgi:hypothetical protein